MVYIRTDSNSIIATGHVMRCISIALELIKMGEKVEFLISDNNSIDLLERYDLDYRILLTDWQDLSREISVVREILLNSTEPMMLIDTYSVTADYINYLNPYAYLIYLGSKEGYIGNVQMLINYSFDINYTNYRCLYPNTQLLLGAKYAPLREEFQNISIHQNTNKIHVMITTGGTDTNNVISDILSGLVDLVDQKLIEVAIVIGPMFQHAEKLRVKYGNYKGIYLYEKIKSMAKLMQQSDIAITANGTTVYELMAAKVSVVSFAMSEEQIQSAEKMQELGIVRYCGKIYEKKELCIANIRRQVLKLSLNEEERKTMIKRTESIVDGKGSIYIAKEIIKHSRCV